MLLRSVPATIEIFQENNGNRHLNVKLDGSEISIKIPKTEPQAESADAFVYYIAMDVMEEGD